jgi:hypothetical protein
MNVVSVIKIFCMFFRLRVEQLIHENSYKYTKTKLIAKSLSLIKKKTDAKLKD